MVGRVFSQLATWNKKRNSQDYCKSPGIPSYINDYFSFSFHNYKNSISRVFWNCYICIKLSFFFIWSIVIIVQIVSVLIVSHQIVIIPFFISSKKMYVICIDGRIMCRLLLNAAVIKRDTIPRSQLMLPTEMMMGGRRCSYWPKIFFDRCIVAERPFFLPISLKSKESFPSHSTREL